MAKSDLTRLKGVSDEDRKQIEQAQEMLGPDPEKMGFIKNLFWGNFREDLVFPYPEPSAEEVARCDQLLAELDEYLRDEHPANEIDQKQEIPEWAIKRLFDLGVMGMIVPKEYGGGSFGVTSYNRVLSRIGRTCGSTAVLVSAHQSIGCGALILFGTEEQKKRYLHRVANDTLSAFCLSEPDVGSDAAGQRTRCELSEDGRHYILNGEKKWATSGAISGFFTVLAKQQLTDESGKKKEGVTALICTPDMAGVDIFSRNRSKCGIRGTWQARIRFTDVKVPVENRLHHEGKGLKIALTCLDYGRCTLAAGMVGAASAALEQAVKWGQHRYQFDRPLAEFEQIRQKLGRMAAWVYAMDAVLYMTTGMLDRDDEDIMLETAICKVFCSDLGFATVNDCLQVMGGESYMTENLVERLWRDSRINMIVEGANEVMNSFIFAYGSKQLGESLLDIRSNLFRHFGAAMRVGAELYLGIKRAAPRITRLHATLDPWRTRLSSGVQLFAHQVKQMLRIHKEKLIGRQLIQARLSWACTWLHAIVCTLSRHDAEIRSGKNGEPLKRSRALVDHFCSIAFHEFDRELRELRVNPDATLDAAVEAVLAEVTELQNKHYAIPESTPVEGARGSGMPLDEKNIPQFGSGSTVDPADVPR